MLYNNGNLFLLKYCFFILFSILFFIAYSSSTPSVASETKAANASGDNNKKPEATNFYLFYERYIKLIKPKVIFNNQHKNENNAFNFELYRYNIICVLASWNDASSVLISELNKHYEHLNQRQVNISAFTSHDQKEQFQFWINKLNPKFFVAIADINYITELLNPPIPTIWLINSKGNIIEKLEMPTIKELFHFFKRIYFNIDY